MKGKNPYGKNIFKISKIYTTNCAINTMNINKTANTVDFIINSK